MRKLLSAGAALAVAGLIAGGAWYVLTRPGHPFDDARACPGTDLRLADELALTGLPLPRDAHDVHYLAHASAPTGSAKLVVGFRSTGPVMRTWLLANHLVPAPDIDTLRDSYPVGDVGPGADSPGVCGGLPPITAPGVDILTPHPSPEGTQQTVEVTLQMDAQNIRPTTEVFLTVLAGRQGA
ncbi:hypothetical protein [Streptomyces sp. 4F14]|uniref:hypothetical protein n=1 Tax=Streptomyces sp. 4F14 TaxID=3394380 RepID=UPI003A88EF89